MQTFLRFLLTFLEFLQTLSLRYRALMIRYRKAVGFLAFLKNHWVFWLFRFQSPPNGTDRPRTGASGSDWLPIVATGYASLRSVTVRNAPLRTVRRSAAGCGALPQTAAEWQTVFLLSSECTCYQLRANAIKCSQMIYLYRNKKVYK